LSEGAFFDVGRFDYARFDEYKPEFLKLVDKLEKHTRGGIDDPAFDDYARDDYSRDSMYITSFEALIKKVESLT